MLSLCVSLPSPSILEHLELTIRLHDFEVNTFYDNLRRVLNPLDFVTTHSPSSKLHRVDINVHYSFQYGEDDDAEPDRDSIFRAVHDGLPLLHMKGMLLVDAGFGSFTDSEPSSVDSEGHELGNQW